MKYDLPSLKAIRAVGPVERHGSITTAATGPHVIPGAISRHIALIEHHFDCELSARLTNVPRLTESGRLYVDRHGEATGLIDRASRRILRSEEQCKTLAVRALGAFSTEWLLPSIPQFETEHAKVGVSVRRSTSGVAFDTDDADMGVHVSRREPTEVDSAR